MLLGDSKSDKEKYGYKVSLPVIVNDKSEDTVVWVTSKKIHSIDKVEGEQTRDVELVKGIHIRVPSRLELVTAYDNRNENGRIFYSGHKFRERNIDKIKKLV